MTREDGLKQIDEALWTQDEYGALNLHVTDEHDQDVHCWLMLRPVYCDRGHIRLCIESHSMSLDGHDSFPRYFFSFEEANQHTRVFLKWRLWKYRTYPHLLPHFDGHKTA